MPIVAKLRLQSRQPHTNDIKTTNNKNQLNKTTRYNEKHQKYHPCGDDNDCVFKRFAQYTGLRGSVQDCRIQQVDTRLQIGSMWHGAERLVGVL